MNKKLEQLQHTNSLPYHPGLITHTQVKHKTADIIPISSVAKAATKETHPLSLSQPVIDAPGLVKLALRMERSVELMKQRVQNNIEAEFERRNELEKESMLKIKESAEKSQAWNNWKELQDLGSLLVSAISTVVGSFLVTSTGSTFIGAAMIASGILAMTNFVFEHTDVWDSIAKQMAGNDDDLEKKIRSLLPTAITIVSSVIALGGAGGAAWFHSLDLTQKAVSIGQAASHLIQGTLIIGAGVHESRAKYTEIALDHIRIEETQVKYHLETFMNQLEEFSKFIDKFVRDSSLIVRATLNTIQVTQQPV